MLWGYLLDREDRIRDSQPANCIRSSLFFLPETDIFKEVGFDERGD